MSWVAVAGAVVAGGVSAYSASQKSSSGSGGGTAQVPWDAIHKLGRLNLGTVPQAAPYQPVDFNQEQIRAILANQNSLPDIQNLVRGGNSIITKDALTQANKLIPGYSSSMATLGSNANSLLHGQLPVNDLQNLVTQAGESANALNIPGLAGPATLRDIGQSQLGAIQSGTGLLGQMVNMAQQISPRSSYINPGSMLTTPGDRVGWDMGQNQLIQQSQQNAFNLAAAPSPNDQAQAQLLVGSALMPRQGVASSLAGIGPAITSASQGLVNAGNQAGWWGSGSSGSAAPAYQDSPGSYYNNSSDISGLLAQGGGNGSFYYGGNSPMSYQIAA